MARRFVSLLLFVGPFMPLAAQTGEAPGSAPSAQGTASGAQSAKPPALPQVGIGYDQPATGASSGKLFPIADPTAKAVNPLYLRVEVFWADVERTKGDFDWTKADALVDRYRKSQHEPVIDLWGGNPLYSEDIFKLPTADDPNAVAAWEEFLRAATRHFKDRVRFFQIGKGPNSSALWGHSDPARSYAFLLKKSSVIVRAESSSAVIVTGGLSGADVEWLDRVYQEGAAPYIDIVSFRPDMRRDLAQACDAVVTEVRAKDGSAGVWLESVTAAGSGEEAGRDLIRKLLTAFDHGASAVFFALPAEETAPPAGGEYLVRAHSAITAGMGRVPSADRIEFVDAQGIAIPAITAVSFYDPTERLSVTGYWANGPAPMDATVHLKARRPGPPAVYDPISGRRTDPVFMTEPGGAKGEIPLGPSPVFLVFREGAAGTTEGESSASLEITAKRGITADEVIEKYRVFQASQDARLVHYTSNAMISYHFRLAGNPRTIDVGMGGTYYFDPKGATEWELKDYYLAGNKSKWKSFPELPLIQPEKVLTLPLDITFDRSYEFEYEGEDTIEGRECHVLKFKPVDTSRSLYRGRLWIDKSTWAKVRVQSTQTNLEPPSPSSEEKTTYAPVQGPNGEEFWVATHIDGQQVYSAAGRSFVVQREIDFSGFHFNDPDFAARQDLAEESDHQILRDTDKGMRYVVKDDSGKRVVKEYDTSQVFGLGGALYDPSLKHVVPLLGANYFDYDFEHTGLQTNLFFAGVFLAWNVTNPNIGGSGFDLGGDLFLSALSHEDKDFLDGVEDDARSVQTRQQSLAVNFGRGLGEFMRLRTSYTLHYQAYGPADGTDPTFVVPEDTLIHTSSLVFNFNRAGFELFGSVDYSVRDRFRFWGDPCQPSNPAPRPNYCTGTSPSQLERRALVHGDDFNPHAQDYFRYQANASKEFYLADFQKLRFVVNVYGGSDLDRFSGYTFDRGDAALPGFAGSGIRFDNGAMLRGAYLFNIAEVIRFEASIGQARVTTKGTPDVTTNNTGIGVSANMLGPWKTVWQLEYGYALSSDVTAVEGNQNLLLIILKLF